MSVKELFATNFYTNPNLVAYWRFESDTNSNPGGLSATDTDVPFTSGFFGNAATYNGSTSKTLFSASDLHMNSTDFTISAWIYLNDLLSSRAIITKNDTGGSTTNAWAFIANGNQLIMLTKDGTAAGTTTSSSSILTASTWTHVAVTHKHSNGLESFYINGLPAGSGTGLTWTGTNSVVTAIGCITNAPAYSYKFNGKIDDLAVFNTLLTDKQIKELAKGKSQSSFLLNFL